jgi:hypothetical protein
MTCAGLLGLAVAHGAVTDQAADGDKENAKNVPDPAKDRALQAGLAALGTSIDHSSAKRKAKGLPAAVAPAGGKAFYFLWSLERVAIAMDLQTIGGKDWYDSASEILVANQKADGAWHGGTYPPEVDTCFALLVLKKANLARDLTASLKGKMSDVTLKAGGVGGEKLTGGTALKPGVEAGDKDKPSDDSPRLKPKDPGDKPKEPTETVKPADPTKEESEGARLARELVKAPAERRTEALDRLRDGKGVEYTEALAAAVPQLDGDGRKKAREALAERLARMKVETLRKYLQDSDAEIRRGAALAAGMKDGKPLIPDLAALLGDAETDVAKAAKAALKALVGEDLGDDPEAWKAWWRKRGRE